MTSPSQHRVPQSTATPIPLRDMIFFSVGVFFFWTALYIYVPILSVYAQSLGASLSMVGLIVAAYAIPQFLFRIPLGILFDSLRRRKWLIAVGILITSAGALGLAVGSNTWALFGARMLTGVGAATWVAFAVYFVAYYPASEAPRAIGIINSVQGVALVISTYAGGLVAQRFGYGGAFFGAAILGLVALAAHLIAKEPVTAHAKLTSRANLSGVFRYWPLLIVSLMGLLAQFANWAGLFGFVPVYAARIGATSSSLGMITMLCLAASALVSLVTVRMVNLVGPALTVVIGSLLLGGTMIFVPSVHTLTALTMLMLINGVGRGLLQTVLMSLSVQSMPQSLRATAMGIYQATYALGMFAGPLVTGLLADIMGLAPAFYVAASACGVVAGLAILPLIRKPAPFHDGKVPT
jgi:MFS family permease